jgi:hypothetical protein
MNTTGKNGYEPIVERLRLGPNYGEEPPKMVAYGANINMVHGGPVPHWNDKLAWEKVFALSPRGAALLGRHKKL